MTASPKLLVLGFDAAEPEFLLDWSHRGLLPHISALMERGGWSPTINPPGLSGATWPSIVTGVNPGRHGRHYYSQIVPGTYRTELLSPRKIGHEPFWSALSRAGKRVAMVDVPKTHPIEGLNGIQIVDWASHDGDTIDGFGTWPAGLKSEIERTYPADVFHGRSFGVRGPADFAAFTSGLVENVSRKTRLVLDLLEREPWDMLFAVWDDLHWAGHFGWRLHDPGHPHHDAELAAQAGDPVAVVGEALDAALGRILDRVGPETTVVLLSSHGMGPGYQPTALLGPILDRLGAGSSARTTTYRSLRKVWDALPGRLHRPLVALKDAVRENLLDADRRRRRFFMLPTNNDGAVIRINLAGREPAGTVQPGADYDECCQWLTDELKAIVNLDTGEPIVQEVHRTASLFQGPLLARLPDLAIEWRSETPVYRAGSPRIGELENTISPWRSGEHLPDGMILFAGAGAGSGRLQEGMRAEDIAPTLCALLGVDLPDADGRPAREVMPVHSDQEHGRLRAAQS